MIGGIGAPEISLLIIIVAVSIIIVLVCREIFCWYWKQTEQVKLLREIRDMLREQAPKKIPKVPERTKP